MAKGRALKRPIQISCLCLLSFEIKTEGDDEFESQRRFKESVMDKKVKWLRISYWTAAIADFIIGLLVLIPARMGVAQHVYPMGLMSAVAISWGILLISADRRPVERRWILLPTLLVVLLLGIVGLHAGLSGLLPVIRIIPTSIVAAAVFSVLAYTYVKTKDLKQSSGQFKVNHKDAQ